MKYAVNVDLDGYFVGPELVPLTEQGVTEIYETLAQGDEDPQPPSPALSGYRVAVPVPQGLYKPRWDIAGWQAAVDAYGVAYSAYQDALAEYDPEGEDPEPQPPSPVDMAAFWIEGLTPQEIDDIINAPKQLTAEERIAQLEADNLNLMLALTEFYEQMIGGSN